MGMRLRLLFQKIYIDHIRKCTTKPSAKELAAISHMSLLAYEKPIVPGYSKIQAKNLHNDQALTEKNFNGVDFLWLYGKWKNISSLILENLPNLDQLAQVFQKENCPIQTLHENGVRVLLSTYNSPQSEKSIDNLRYTQFIKSTKLNKPVQLSNIPPTRAAAHQHISRVYYQVQTWLGNHLEPKDE
ncbi:uncharacterized protein TNIN_270001 [Trichonephila inaurata madagascariensis]|uniref:Uncharacterized protein n=1 Tax=Trichonephila inaurata madagascariensis TaxID=2747483 RepID=A0A8X6XC95_9ARAC|nr:uncharacterized protein TNIN_270001 [Trichonephila inaurata madagascariensis]